MLYIEVNHLTIESANDFGIRIEQINLINQLLYGVPDNIHNMVLDVIYKDGIGNVRYKLTVNNADLLIECLANQREFVLVEFDTPEWHEWKKIKAIRKQLNNK